MCRIGKAGLASFVSQAVVCGIKTNPKTVLNLYVYRFKSKVWIPALGVEFSLSLQRRDHSTGIFRSSVLSLSPVATPFRLVQPVVLLCRFPCASEPEEAAAGVRRGAEICPLNGDRSGCTFYLSKLMWFSTARASPPIVSTRPSTHTQ